MKIAVLSDIHGNIEAFDAVWKELGTISPDRIISLGDNVGYGADSEAVIRSLETRGIRSVLGNHEFAVVNESFINWFNPSARIAVHHTRKTLSDESVSVIRQFKKSFVAEGARFVHGAPENSVAVYLFQISDKKLAGTMVRMDEPITFTGHTHTLGLIEHDGETLVRRALREGITKLDRAFRYIVNAGSVGQPRDGDNRAKYVLFDTERYSIDVRCVRYDTEKAARKILDAGLPEIYADRIR